MEWGGTRREPPSADRPGNQVASPHIPHGAIRLLRRVFLTDSVLAPPPPAEVVCPYQPSDNDPAKTKALGGGG